MNDLLVGLEIHLQLNTKTKLWCSCSTENNLENANTCEICLGHPGVLPSLNKGAVEKAIKLALALNSNLQNYSSFDRKHYFYPDLSKNYQITQYYKPYATGGYLDIKGTRVGIRNLQIEEDAGKSIYREGNRYIDYNRAGIPLIEIVTHPHIKTIEVLEGFLKEFYNSLKYLGISDLSMEEGSLRVDANISIGSGYRVEVKNLNSFKAVSKAVKYEYHRQKELLVMGEKLENETRLWDEDNNSTKRMRVKEDSLSYSFLPEPDLKPLIIDEEWIDELRANLPELMPAKIDRFVNEYMISEESASIISREVEVADYFERFIDASISPKLASNWLIANILPYLQQKRVTIDTLDIEEMAKLLMYIEKNIVTKASGKTIFEEFVIGSGSIDEIIKAKNLLINDNIDELNQVIITVLEEGRSIVDDWLAASEEKKDRILQSLIGPVMKETNGRFSGKVVVERIKEVLRSRYV